MGILLLPGSENVWPETFTWEIAIGDELLFVILTLLLASWPIGTFPKLTALGETRRLPPTGSTDPAPQPDVAIAKQDASAITRAFPHPLNCMIFTPDRMRCPFPFENSPLNVAAGADMIWPENSEIAEISDTNITSSNLQNVQRIRGRAKGKEAIVT
jgi:hypothetical protein